MASLELDISEKAMKVACGKQTPEGLLPLPPELSC